MKILVYGSLNIDLVYGVEKIVVPGETISSHSFSRNAGGKGANQAAALGKALAKAGIDTWMAGKTGRDGDFLLELLESFGVKTEKVVRYDGPSGQAIIQVDKNGQNSIILYAGGNGLVTPQEIDNCLSCMEEGDLVLLQNEITNTDLIIKKAKELKFKVALNPSPWNERAQSFPMELVDIFFVNEIEGAGIAGADENVPPEKILETLCARFPKAEIILTAGKDGAFYGCGQTRASAKAQKVTAVDTTGAGDCFSGYFLAARAKGFSVQDSLNSACKAAAITVSRKGAMESIPFADEVF